MTKDVFSIIGTIGGITLGVIGLTTWKRQLKGTSEYELAKRAIFITYQVRQLIKLVRNPILHLSREEVEAGNTLQEQQRIYDDRMQELHLKWAELQTIRLETKVIWFDAAHDSFNTVEMLIGELRGAIWLHFWMKGAYADPSATVDNSPERIAENNKVIYYASEDDEFSVKINAAVAEVETFFQLRVRGK